MLPTESQLLTLCRDYGVDQHDLMQKVCDGLAGVSIDHFTDEELKVIKEALEIAGEF